MNTYANTIGREAGGERKTGGTSAVLYGVIGGAAILALATGAVTVPWTIFAASLVAINGFMVLLLCRDTASVSGDEGWVKAFYAGLTAVAVIPVLGGLEDPAGIAVLATIAVYSATQLILAGRLPEQKSMPARTPCRVLAYTEKPQAQETVSPRKAA